MRNKEKNLGYVTQLTGGNNIPSIFSLLGINLNYKFVINKSKDIHILEIGPGNGFFIDYLLMNGFKNITYVDLDEENVGNLMKKYNNIKEIRGFSDDGVNFLKNINEKYDLIISRQVIEHLDSDSVRDYFKYSYEHLNDEGTLITETINSQNIIYGNFYRYIDSTHKNSFTEKSLKEFGGKYFQLSFYEYLNFGVTDIIKYFFNKKIKKSYQLLLNIISTQGKNYCDNGEGTKLQYKKYLTIIKLIYYKWKSKKISKRYLSGIDPSAQIFTDNIIIAGKRI